jgi:hypothetical protein
MVRIVRAHAGDVAALAVQPLEDVFRLVADAAYTREPFEWRAQILARPALTASKRVPVVACANKSIILASWAHLRRIPWRLVAVGNKAGHPPHHVFPELWIGGTWRAVDATYPWGVLFHSKPYPVRLVACGLEAPT